MRHGKDHLTLDLFFTIPQPTHAAPGQGNYSAQVSQIVSDILKASPLDRDEVAAHMTALSGDHISTAMLNAWSSPARLDNNLPFYRAALIEEVCSSHLLTDWLVSVRGGHVAYGRDALNAELGRLERQRDEAARQARELKRLLSGGKHA
ncbi:hypothetical protein [Pseudomonas sp. F(2018)]|uniref:hypothetical protein n=1 Tax=Pseudomonas sp. F(2018) TaxID=2502240 RepID=UPI0010F73209|nr:hypothetical protein [Pseudomonas sp. F(2018)]